MTMRHAGRDKPGSALLARLIAWGGGILGIDPSLLLHSSFLLFATVFGQALGFGVQIVMARRIGVESYGIYAYAFTWISLLALVATMGADQLLIRYVSEYRARGELSRLYGVIRWCSVASSVATALVVTAAVFASVMLLPMTATLWAVILWSAATLLIMVAAGLVESALRAEESHLWATLPSRLLRPLLMGGMFISLPWFMAGPLDAQWAIAVNAVSAALAALVAFAALWPLLPCRPVTLGSMPTRVWLGTSLAFGIHALAVYLNGNIDMLLLGFFHGGTTLGIYGAIVRIATVMHFSTITVNMVIQPMIVRTIATSTHADLQRLVAGGARFVFLASVSCAILIFLFAEPILSIFGEGFEAGATALRILSFGYAVSGLVNLAGTLLSMAGHQQLATAVVLGGVVLTLALNLLLVPRYGAIGAATGTAASGVLWNFALFLFAYKRLGIIVAPLTMRRRSRDTR